MCCVIESLPPIVLFYTLVASSAYYIPYSRSISLTCLVSFASIPLLLLPARLVFARCFLSLGAVFHSIRIVEMIKLYYYATAKDNTASADKLVLGLGPINDHRRVVQAMMFHDLRDMRVCYRWWRSRVREELLSSLLGTMKYSCILLFAAHWLSVFRWLAGAVLMYNSLNVLDCVFRLLMLTVGLYRLPSAAVQNWPIHSSLSLQEFWSYRWNSVIQRRMLKSCVYRPLVNVFRSLLLLILPASATGGDENDTIGSVDRMARSLGRLTTFVVSGLWHTLPIWLASAVNPSLTTEMILGIFWFFLLQAAGISVERKLLGINGWPCRLARRLWTVGYVAVCSPLIIEPFLRLKILL